MGAMGEPSLVGRNALVTGASRRAGIGYAIASRLLDEGAAVCCQAWSVYDAGQPWGDEPAGVVGLEHDLVSRGRVTIVERDLEPAGAAGELVDVAGDHVGALDILVVNHARDSAQRLEELTEDELDATWRVNARATVMLVKAFAAQHDDSRRGGRVVLFTSGQHLAPMTSELPYAISKGAIHQMTLTLADALAERGITVNAVNPGPTDTGWASPELSDAAARALPRGRWNTPGEAAAVVAWLVSDDAATVTGQVIDAEAGFRRWRL
jgi:3-oxoacyl-[acyl-carrier protein] reductase